MERIKETFVDKIKDLLSLRTVVCEVGSGDGRLSHGLAKHVSLLVGIEPEKDECLRASARKIKNAHFVCGRAEKLPLRDASVDVVLYTLCLHHVEENLLQQALDEARRVVQPHGLVIVLEPTNDGSFFEAEVTFNACDGDERRAKAAVVRALMQHRGLYVWRKMSDLTEFRVESAEDFKDAMRPRRAGQKLKNVEQIAPFLECHGHQLVAHRVIYLVHPR